MQSKVGRRAKWLFTTAICTSILDPFGFTHAAGFAAPEHGENVDAAAAFHTQSPIKHVIISSKATFGSAHQSKAGMQGRSGRLPDTVRAGALIGFRPATTPTK
jgi:hypothetical protein